MKLKLISILLLISSYTFAFEMEIVATKHNDSLTELSGSMYGNDEHIILTVSKDIYTLNISKVVSTDKRVILHCEDNVIVIIEYIDEYNDDKYFNIVIVTREDTLVLLAYSKNR